MEQTRDYGEWVNMNANKKDGELFRNIPRILLLPSRVNVDKKEYKKECHSTRCLKGDDCSARRLLNNSACSYVSLVRAIIKYMSFYTLSM